MEHLFLFLVISTLCFTSHSSSFYHAGFEDGVPGTEWSHNLVSQTPTGNRRFLGPFEVEDVTLSLSILKPHSHVSIAFDLFVIGTWDGNGEACCGPDIWKFSLLTPSGEQVILQTTFSNDDFPFDEGFNQSFPGQYPGSSSFHGLTGSIEKSLFGYPDQSGYIGVGDSVYRLKFLIPHTLPSITFQFSRLPRNLPFEDNEPWGLDNVEVVFSKGELFSGVIVILIFHFRTCGCR